MKTQINRAKKGWNRSNKHRKLSPIKQLHSLNWQQHNQLNPIRNLQTKLSIRISKTQSKIFQTNKMRKETNRLEMAQTNSLQSSKVRVEVDKASKKLKIQKVINPMRIHRIFDNGLND